MTNCYAQQNNSYFTDMCGEAFAACNSAFILIIMGIAMAMPIILCRVLGIGISILLPVLVLSLIVLAIYLFATPFSQKG